MRAPDPGISTRLERAVDAVVRMFSRKSANRRLHFRAMERDPDYREAIFAAMSARGYRAASRGKGSGSFSDARRSADAEILGDLPALRNRSRELNQDDPIGSGLTGTFVNGAIGTGLWPKPQPHDAEGRLDTKKAGVIERVWWRLADRLYRGERLTHAAAQRLRFRKVMEDGEIFRRAVKLGPSDPLWFELVEADRVGTPPDKLTSSAVRDGIERDANGVPVAAYVAKSHPGDTVASTFARAEYVRVEFPHIEQIGFKERPGQSRCVPHFHAVVQDLRDLDLLLLASLKRTQISACMALVIKTLANADEILPLTAEAYGYKLDQQIEPGMIFKLYPGEEIQTVIPNFPVPELGPFIVILCRRIGAALGVSWQVVLRDFSESTYSSARTDKLDCFQTWDVQQYLFVEMDLAPEYRAVMTDAILRGEPELVAAGVTLADVQDVDWIPNGRAWIDPQKEANANKLALEMKITSRSEICARLGKHYPDVLEQILQDELLETGRRAALGLPAVAPAVPPTPEQPGPQPTEEPEEPPRRGLFSLFRRTA